MVEVVYTDEFGEWYEGLDEPGAEDVYVAVGVLKDQGVALGFPRSSAIEGCKYAIRELRVQSQGRPIRVFYAFDPRRDAVLILGGDKTGTTNARFYEALVPKCEKIWEDYLAEQAGGGKR